jgi:predicted dehydrogenase
LDTRPGAALRAAVIGVGAFGRHHARIFHEMGGEDVRLVGLVDLDVEGPRPIADSLGVPLVSSVDELPGGVDVVSVAVPTTAHRRVAEPLLRRGVHCLVEKPIAGSTADAQALVNAAESAQACLQVGLVERFNPVTAALDRLGDAPIYVEVHRLAPFPARALDVGVVMDLMIHDLDILNHLVGEEAQDVRAVGVCISGEHEDVVNARVTFPSGCVANLTASRVSDQRMRRIRIFTRSGYLSLDYDGREARIVRPRRRKIAGWGEQIADLAARPALLDDTRTSGRRPAFEELLRTERLRIDDAEPLRAEIESLVDAVRHGRRPSVCGVDGLRALGLAERILASIRAQHEA